MDQIFKAAVVQAAPVLFDRDATVTKLGCLARESAGATLVVFPEAFVGSYPKGLASASIEFYCAPIVDDRDTWRSTMRTSALERRWFVLSACQYLTRGDGPPDFHPMQDEDAETGLIRGGSCIIDPLGNVLAEPEFNCESICYAEIDRRMITRGKYDLDVTGHYGRPDVFSLSVNTKPQSVVSLPP